MKTHRFSRHMSFIRYLCHMKVRECIAMNTKTLDQLKDKYYGPLGTPERERLENELEALRIGFNHHPTLPLRGDGTRPWRGARDQRGGVK